MPPRKRHLDDSLIGVRNLRRHAKLRRPWNDALKVTSLPDYEDMLLVRAEQFVNKLKELSRLEKAPGTSIDLASWISCFTFVSLDSCPILWSYRVLFSDLISWVILRESSSRSRESHGTDLVVSALEVSTLSYEMETGRGSSK